MFYIGDSLNSKKRKNCIIVLNVILDCLLKWFAPILVFTTDEIHSLIDKSEESIHEHQFPSILKIGKITSLMTNGKNFIELSKR